MLLEINYDESSAVDEILNNDAMQNQFTHEINSEKQQKMELINEIDTDKEIQHFNKCEETVPIIQLQQENKEFENQKLNVKKTIKKLKNQIQNKKVMVNRLRSRIYRRDKKLKDLSSIIDELKNKELISENAHEVLKVILHVILCVLIL